MNILSVDPGLSTGVAIFLNGEYETDVISVEIDNPKTREPIYSLVCSIPWDIVLCERFITAGRMSKYGIVTIELIGAIKALCWKNVLTLVINTPQKRLSYVQDAKKLLGNTYYVDHQMDALAHLLAYQSTIKKANKNQKEAC